MEKIVPLWPIGYEEKGLKQAFFGCAVFEVFKF